SLLKIRGFLSYQTMYSVLSFSLTLIEILNMLDLGDHLDKAFNIVIVPHNDKDAVVSDCDSDGSDMDYGGETGHLPAKLLSACSELMQKENERNNEDDWASPCQRVQSKEPQANVQVMKNKDRVFKRSKRPTTAGIPTHTVYSPNAAECVKQNLPNPMDVFLLLFPPTLRELTVKMWKLYSTQTKDKQLYLNMDDSVSRRHIFWSLDSDVHNKNISDAMQRNQFDDMMASIHVVDNTKITDYPFFKVRPIPFLQNHYHPILWLPWILADQAQVPQGRKFFHDNLFNSLSLLDERRKSGFGSSGTIRQNCLFDVPFKSQKDFKKLPRGTSEVLTQGEKMLVRWKDNNVVTVATNMEEKCSETSHMGGVDLHDLQVSRFHVSIRSKKWWWPFFLCYWRTIDLLTFSRECCSLLCKSSSIEPWKDISSGHKVKDQARYDKYSHWPINTMQRFHRCRYCDKRTTCEKCKAPLHIECLIYHCSKV
uniref:PiggyBac transposable element-derived protein domain-containing protein n=1 Tax=Labrus bergylta TaxID=56723 RepID=A0A3Q3GCL7_9LABR